MTDAFVVGDGTLRVLAPDGAYQPIATPEGYTDAAFRNVVAAVDTAYRMDGRFPEVKRVAELIPRVPIKTVGSLMATEQVRAALEYRGVSVDENAGLSLEQSMVLLKVLDFTDKRSLGAKLKELGVPMPRYQAWLKQPVFAEHYRKRSEDQFSGAVPLALNALISNADSGDTRSIEKLLEITGRYNPAQQQLEDVKAILLRVVEAIIRNVPDPEVRLAIMADIQSATAGYAMLTAETRALGG